MTSTPDTPDDEPIRHFSDCHAGIVAQLDELGQLPALLDPARQARLIAARSLKFFREAVFEHHAEEERELFPAVLASAVKGDERDAVQAIVDALTQEHRRVEAAWTQIEPALKRVAAGDDAELDGAAVATLVTNYQAHARYEEQNFLPLAETILGRNGNHMAALGVSLHMRHALPELRRRYGFHL